VKHFSLRTERAYAEWVYRFVVHHRKRHPRDLGAREVQSFLTWLAVERNVAASTRNQALCASLFLCREVLGIELPRIEDAVRARRSRRVPTALTRDEVRAVVGHLAGPHALGQACCTPAACGWRRCGRGEDVDPSGTRTWTGGRDR
jgi:integrase